MTTNRIFHSLLLCVLGGTCLEGQASPKVFELEIPEFGERLFDGDLVELPLPKVNALVIHLLNPVAERVAYSKIFPKLNGDAAATICQYGSTDRGKYARMNLAMRRDLRLSGGSNTLEVLAIDQRGRRYYKNFILRTREQARNEWFAYETSVSPADEAAAPPDVLVTSPEFPVTFRANDEPLRVAVKGSVTAAHPLTAVKVNGTPVAIPANAGTVEFSREVVVSPKDRQIAIAAVDQRGNRTQVTVPVVIAGQRSPFKFTGERYALVIGISHYGVRPGGPPDLNTAASDAESLASVLKTRAGFRPDHVLFLRDENATAANIRNGFRNFVARAKPDDLLLLYVAGQGLHDPFDGSRIFLSAYDTQMKQLGETALEFQELQELLSSNVRSRNAILAFDVGRKVPADWRIVGNNLVNSYLLKLFSGEQGRTVLVSGGVNETSAERRADGRPEGVFTRCLIEALEGKADWDQDRAVTVGEVFRYVSERVRAETAGAQTPRYHIAQQSLPLSDGGN